MGADLEGNTRERNPRTRGRRGEIVPGFEIGRVFFQGAAINRFRFDKSSQSHQRDALIEQRLGIGRIPGLPVFGKSQKFRPKAGVTKRARSSNFFFAIHARELKRKFARGK